MAYSFNNLKIRAIFISFSPHGMTQVMRGGFVNVTVRKLIYALTWLKINTYSCTFICNAIKCVAARGHAETTILLHERASQKF